MKRVALDRDLGCIEMHHALRVPRLNPLPRLDSIRVRRRHVREFARRDVVKGVKTSFSFRRPKTRARRASKSSRRRPRTAISEVRRSRRRLRTSSTNASRYDDRVVKDRTGVFSIRAERFDLKRSRRRIDPPRAERARGTASGKRSRCRPQRFTLRTSRSHREGRRLNEDIWAKPVRCSALKTEDEGSSHRWPRPRKPSRCEHEHEERRESSRRQRPPAGTRKETLAQEVTKKKWKSR